MMRDVNRSAKTLFAGGLVGLAAVISVPVLMSNAQASPLAVGVLGASPGLGDLSPTPTATATGGGGPCLQLICDTPTPTPTPTLTPSPTPHISIRPTIKPTPTATVIKVEPTSTATQNSGETFPTGAPPPGAAGSDENQSVNPSFGVGSAQLGSSAPTPKPATVSTVSKERDPVTSALLLALALGALLGLGGGLGLYLTRGNRAHPEMP